MTLPSITVLHVVGGAHSQGGVDTFVNQIASVPLPEVRSLVWKHHAFQASSGSPNYVCEGRVTRTDVGALGDLIGAAREVLPLWRWTRRQECVILHAHSRMGILAAWVVSRLAGVALVIHLHGLWKRRALYRRLCQSAGTKVVFNSRKTCVHFGEDPEQALILMPGIRWPKKPPATRAGVRRFIAAGLIVPGKHFREIVVAFRQLIAEGYRAELHIFGRSDAPLDSQYQQEIEAACRSDDAICLRNWAPDWTSELCEDDIFIHMGEPESFGIVILEAFAQGCRLIVLGDTFLNDFAAPVNALGVFRVEHLAVANLVQQMKLAITMVDSQTDLWNLRRPLSDMFQNESTAATLAPFYRALIQK